MRCRASQEIGSFDDVSVSCECGSTHGWVRRRSSSVGTVSGGRVVSSSSSVIPRRRAAVPDLTEREEKGLRCRGLNLSFSEWGQIITDPRLVADARDQGYSWAQIADLLGVTRASAWQY